MVSKEYYVSYRVQFDLRPKLIPGEECVPLSNGVTPAPQ